MYKKGNPGAKLVRVIDARMERRVSVNISSPMLVPRLHHNPNPNQKFGIENL